MFSWTGDPLYKIVLNEGIGAMAPFAVDELNKNIYVVNPQKMNDYLSVFDIGEIEY
jgi:DNA-binding beta-propeller fold protein YncE